jgi:hypothetical protein
LSGFYEEIFEANPLAFIVGHSLTLGSA